MTYHNTRSNATCAGLGQRARTAGNRAREMKDHIDFLKNKISVEQQKLERLRDQVDRTGDPKGFEPAIGRIKEKIENLYVKIERARETLQAWFAELDSIGRDMQFHNCPGFVTA